MTTITEPTALEAATWITLRGALKLEALGMKNSRRSALAIARERLNTRGNRAQCLALVEAKIEALRLELEAQRKARTVPLMRDE